MSKNLYATHKGNIKIGDLELECYVLSDKRRVFVKKAMGNAFGLQSKGGNAFTKTMTQGNTIRSILGDEILNKIDNPIVFSKSEKSKTQGSYHGYEADILIEICDAIFQGNKEGKLHTSQEFLAKQSEILIRSFAKVGVIALIDEVTGYQEDRNRQALQEILDSYLSKEFSPWAKRFPDEFYKEIFRLKGLDYNSLSTKRPQYIGIITNNIV